MLRSMCARLASDWGELDFVVPPGPLATSGVPEFDELLDKAKANAPAHSLVSIDDLGVAPAFLAHDAARRLITGETFYIDGGYHIID